MKKIVYPFIFFLLFVLVSGLMGIFFLFKTQSGSTFILKNINKILPGELTYDEVEGAIIGNLTIKNIHYHSSQIDIQIGKLSSSSGIKLLPFSFINQKLILEDLHLVPHLMTIPKNSSKHAQFHLPIKINFENILLQNSELKLSRKKIIKLPTLNGKIISTAADLQIFIFQSKLNETAHFLHYYSAKQTQEFHVNLKINNSEWKLNYRENQNNFLANGDILDQQGGKISIAANGKTDQNWQCSILSNNFHLNAIWPQYWPGKLNFKAFAYKNKQNTYLDLTDIAGDIQNQPIQGFAHILIKDNQIPKLNIDLKSGKAIVKIVGQLNSQWQIKWLCDIPELRYILPQNKGRLLYEGELSGPYFSSNFVAQDLSYNNFIINQLQMKIGGTLKKHQITGFAKFKDEKLNFSLVGNFKDFIWSSSFTEFNITTPKEKWHLLSPATLAISKQGWAINLFHLMSDQNTIFFEGNYQAHKSFVGTLNVNNFDLSLLNFLLPPKQQLEGRLTLNGFVTYKKKSTDLQINADIKPGTFNYYANNTIQKLAFTNGRLKTYLDKNKALQLQLFILFMQGNLQAKITLPDIISHYNQLLEQKVNGKVQINLSQPKLLEPFIPSVKNIQGVIQGKFNIDGTIKKLQISSDIALDRGGFQIPKLNLNISNLQLTAHGNGKDLQYNGSLKSGNGNLSIRGKSLFSNNQLLTDLQLQGTNVLICNNPEIKITASPQINLKLSQDELFLSGKILIPEANLHPHDFGETESMSDDIIFLQPNGQTVRNSAFKITSSIQLLLGNKISLNCKGIKGQIIGQMRIYDNPDTASIAYGQLQIQDGAYSIYGRTLQIDSGKLNFMGGPINNPSLEIRASRSLQSYGNNLLLSTQEQLRVGVSVLGTLHEPKINLFSEPAGKSTADILSYLILGVPSNSVSGANTELLLQAADAINLGGTSKILDIKNQIKKGLGLSELDIGTSQEMDLKTQETIQHTAFVLGKYLSPKFYVNYSLDLFDHTNTLKVRYLLNKFWTIQSVTNNNGSGIDVLYTIEK